MFLFKAESPVWVDHILCVHSSVDGHMDCLHFVAVMNNAITNPGGYIFLYCNLSWVDSLDHVAPY